MASPEEIIRQRQTSQQAELQHLQCQWDAELGNLWAKLHFTGSEALRRLAVKGYPGGELGRVARSVPVKNWRGKVIGSTHSVTEIAAWWVCRLYSGEHGQRNLYLGSDGELYSASGSDYTPAAIHDVANSAELSSRTGNELVIPQVKHAFWNDAYSFASKTQALKLAVEAMDALGR